MAELTFSDLGFSKEKDEVKVSFLKLFYSTLSDSDLRGIGDYELGPHSISFPKVSQEKAARKFNSMLGKSFENLRNRMTHKPAVYIHRHSGIPLLGTNYFGVIDRGTNVLEVKPLTSCNISCTFCSVDEGPTSRRKVDFVVEKDYLVEEFRKVVEYKGVKDMDAHINAQGEPTLYGDLVPLVRDIMHTPNVTMSSIDTNGTILSEKFIDELAEAGLKRINLSLHAIDQKIANTLAGAHYNVKRVMDMARYATKKMDLIITPVWMPGYNDHELARLAKFAEEIGAGKDCPPIGIQNFLPYKMGRNPIEQIPFDAFFKRMHELEEEHKVTLIHKRGFNIYPVKELKKPFRKNEVVSAEIKLPGRIGKEKLAVARERIISIPQCEKESGMVKVRIRRTKHNVFSGELI